MPQPSERKQQPLRHVSSKASRLAAQSYAVAPFAERVNLQESHLAKKGVEHRQPIFVWLGAAFMLLLALSIIGCIAVTGYHLLHETTDLFWLLLCCTTLMISLIGFLNISIKAPCTVCRGAIFSLRHYERHSKAHRLPGLGHLIPTALHIMLFRWFRCPYCGSAQQLGAHKKHIE